jgi:hypothetical protein
MKMEGSLTCLHRGKTIRARNQAQNDASPADQEEVETRLPQRERSRNYRGDRESVGD